MDLETLDRESIIVWPCLAEERLGDWILRFGGNVYGRSNSVQPYGDPGCSIEEAVEKCEDAYQVAGLRPMFRLPHCIDCQDLDRLLIARGYEISDEADVMVGPTAGRELDKDVVLLDQPHERWLSAYRQGSGRGAGREDVVAQILLRVKQPRAFAQIEAGGQIACVGLGAIHESTLWLFSIATVPEHRGRGLAKRLVSTLLAWSVTHGATRSALQVSSSNEPAVRLYEGLGFGDAYGYRYRRL